MTFSTSCKPKWSRDEFISQSDFTGPWDDFVVPAVNSP
jgi:hypothetical protein